MRFLYFATLIIWIGLCLSSSGTFAQQKDSDTTKIPSDEFSILNQSSIWSFSLDDDLNDNILSGTGNQKQKFADKLLPKEDVFNEQSYFEDSARRFDVVFFLSTPVFLIYHLLLAQIITSSVNIRGNDDPGILRFSSHQWLYTGLSSILMGLGVALDDYQQMSKKKNIQAQKILFEQERMSSSSKEKKLLSSSFFLRMGMKFNF